MNVREQALLSLTQAMKREPHQRIIAWRDALDLIHSAGYADGYQAALLDSHLVEEMVASEQEVKTALAAGHEAWEELQALKAKHDDQEERQQ